MVNTGTTLLSTIKAVADHHATPRRCGIVHGDADAAAVTRTLDNHDVLRLVIFRVRGQKEL